MRILFQDKSIEPFEMKTATTNKQIPNVFEGYEQRINVEAILLEI